MRCSGIKFLLKIACIGECNTTASYGGKPGVYGPVVMAAALDFNGNFYPCGEIMDKGPEIALRGARVFTGGSELLSVLDNSMSLRIGPFEYKPFEYADILLQVAEHDPVKFLSFTSTSPACEPDDYVKNTTAVFRFFLEHSDWRSTFKGNRGRNYTLGVDGSWQISLSLPDDD